MGFPSPDDIMAHVTSGFTSRQLQAVRKVSSPDDIPSACPQNFNLFSQCFAAVAFNVLPTSANDTTPYDYTIRADGGLFHIDVVKHTSDYERRILPLQWALDSVRFQHHPFLRFAINDRAVPGHHRAKDRCTNTHTP